MEYAVFFHENEIYVTFLEICYDIQGLLIASCVAVLVIATPRLGIFADQEIDLVLAIVCVYLEMKIAWLYQEKNTCAQ